MEVVGVSTRTDAEGETVNLLSIEQNICASVVKAAVKATKAAKASDNEKALGSETECAFCNGHEPESFGF